MQIKVNKLSESAVITNPNTVFHFTCYLLSKHINGDTKKYVSTLIEIRCNNLIRISLNQHTNNPIPNQLCNTTLHIALIVNH